MQSGDPTNEGARPRQSPCLHPPTTGHGATYAFRLRPLSGASVSFVTAIINRKVFARIRQFRLSRWPGRRQRRGGGEDPLGLGGDSKSRS